jgi:hypothetical protein
LLRCSRVAHQAAHRGLVAAVKGSAMQPSWQRTTRHGWTRQGSESCHDSVRLQPQPWLLRSVSSRYSSRYNSSRRSAALRMIICRTQSRRTWGLWTVAATSGWLLTGGQGISGCPGRCVRLVGGCPAQQCQQQPQLETLTHLFVECPVAAAVWQWFAQLWQLVQPGAVVPVSSSRVLLLDDDSVWAPPLAKQQLWTYMRLLLLESIWVMRCTCHNTSQAGGSQDSNDSSSSSSCTTCGSQGNNGHSQADAAGTSGNGRFTAKAVACRFRSQLQQQMRRDWRRVGVDVRLVARPVSCALPYLLLGQVGPHLHCSGGWGHCRCNQHGGFVREPAMHGWDCAWLGQKLRGCAGASLSGVTRCVHVTLIC